MALTPKQSKAIPIIFIGALLLLISEPVAQAARGNVSDLAMAAILLLNPIGLIFLVIGIYRYFRK
jgi:hypothetical protein